MKIESDLPGEGNFVLGERELAGFDIAAVKLPGGGFRLTGTNPRVIAEFPVEITLLGATYTLEHILEFNPYEDGVFVNAVYV